MPCTSLFPTTQHHPSFSLRCLSSARVPTSPDQVPRIQLVRPFYPLLSCYSRQYSVGGTRRQSGRVEAEHPHAQRTTLYYRSRLTASPSTRGQRTSHRSAISRPGYKGHRNPIHPAYAHARDRERGRKYHVGSRTGASPLKKSGSELLRSEGSAAYRDSVYSSL
jgi:hypothetical protein